MISKRKTILLCGRAREPSENEKVVKSSLKFIKGVLLIVINFKKFHSVPENF